MPRSVPSSGPCPPRIAIGTRVVPAKEVAATRLQLRWVEDDQGEAQYRCLYELVLALAPEDIRREQYGPRGGRRPDRKAQVISLGHSGRNSHGRPCYLPTDQGEVLYYDTPRYDGKHAEWDAGKLGGLPIYVITLDGVYLQDDPPARREGSA